MAGRRVGSATGAKFAVMVATLITLIKAFWGICSFRLAPQDVPPSSALLALTAAMNLAISIFINRMNLALEAAVLVALIEIFVLTGLTSALLYSFAKTARIRQTLTALMGTGALIGVLSFTALVLFPALPQPLRVAIFLWNLFVMAHILRYALDTRFIIAFFVAIGYAVLLIQLVVFVDRVLHATLA